MGNERLNLGLRPLSRLLRKVFVGRWTESGVEEGSWEVKRGGVGYMRDEGGEFCIRVRTCPVKGSRVLVCLGLYKETGLIRGGSKDIPTDENQ